MSNQAKIHKYIENDVEIEESIESFKNLSNDVFL